MAKQIQITTIGGVLRSNSLIANMDGLYGPYDSEPDAVSALGQRRLSSAACVGQTVGIKDATTGEVAEYWVQPDGKGGYGLKPKGGSEGKSAYEVYVDNYKSEHEGSADGAMSETAWLASLKGADGDGGQSVPAYTHVEHSGATPASFAVSGGEYHTFADAVQALAFTLGGNQWGEAHLEFTTGETFNGVTWPQGIRFANQEPMLDVETTYLMTVLHGIVAVTEVVS